MRNPRSPLQIDYLKIKYFSACQLAHRCILMPQRSKSHLEVKIQLCPAYIMGVPCPVDTLFSLLSNNLEFKYVIRREHVLLHVSVQKTA